MIDANQYTDLHFNNERMLQTLLNRNTIPCDIYPEVYIFYNFERNPCHIKNAVFIIFVE